MNTITIPSTVRYIIRNHKDLAALAVLVGFRAQYRRHAVEKYELASPMVRPEYRLTWDEFVESWHHIHALMPHLTRLRDLWFFIMGRDVLPSQVHQWAYDPTIRTTYHLNQEEEA